jgi:hypothetical protein
MPLGAIRIPQLNFGKFSSPNIEKITGGGAYSALTGQRNGIKLQNMEATESKDANASGMKNLKARGY